MTSVGRCPGIKTREHQSQHRCSSQSDLHSRPTSPARFAVRSHSAPQIACHLGPSPPLRCAQAESTPILSPPFRSESAIRRPCVARSNVRKSPFTGDRRPNWSANRPSPQTVASTRTFANRPSPQATAPNPQPAFRAWLARMFANHPSRKNLVAPSSCVRKLQAAKRAPPFLRVPVSFGTHTLPLLSPVLLRRTVLPLSLLRTSLPWAHPPPPRPARRPYPPVSTGS